jgi:hypothetical protein
MVRRASGYLWCGFQSSAVLGSFCGMQNFVKALPEKRCHVVWLEKATICVNRHWVDVVLYCWSVVE